MRPGNDGMRLHSRFSRLGMKIDPIHTTLGDIAGVGKVNIPARSKGGLIGEVLKSGEVDAGSVGQVLSVDAKRPIEQWTKVAGPAFMIIWFVIRFVIWFVIWFVIRFGVILGWILGMVLGMILGMVLGVVLGMVLGMILGMILGVLRFVMTFAFTSTVTP